MQKAILIGNMLAALLFGGFIFLQVPFTKLPTDNAMAAIDREVRTNLDENARAHYDFNKKWVLANDSALRRSWSNAWWAGLIFCLLTFISNGLLLGFGIRDNKRGMTGHEV